MSTPKRFQVVTDADGIIRAVYPEEELAAAQGFARRTNLQVGFPLARVEQLTSGADPSTPKVGQRVGDLLRLGLMHQRST
jgi:hypothetical protein